MQRSSSSSLNPRAPRPRPLCRRLFLRGLGGVSVGLPFLPSLATRTAYAQDPVFPRERFFYALTTDHGAAFDSNFFPDLATIDQSVNYAGAGHVVRWGRLAGRQEGANTVLSPCLTAPTARLSARMISKLNVLYGLDTAMHVGHCRGAMLGNFADTDGQNRLGQEHRPTIDQIMAWSPSFYSDLSAIRERSMAYGHCWGYSNPGAQSGTVQPVRTNYGARDLFNRIFIPPNTGPAPARRQPIVDRVLESYRRLRTSNRRLSAADRQRLDDHLSHLSEVQRRLDASAPVTRSCADVTPVTANPNQYGDGYSFSNPAEYVRIWNDVFAAAFACGSSRIAVMNGGGLHRGNAYEAGANWHQDIAHQYSLPASQTRLTAFYSGVFSFAFLDLAQKLDQIPSTPGRSVLDDALLVWTQEAGMDTHWQISVPVVTAGSAGGAFKTGMFVDYRNRESNQVIQLGSSLSARDRTQRHGLLYNQFLATALQGVGVPPNEFERWGHRGYGAVGYGTSPGELPSAQGHGATMNYYGTETSKYFQIASDRLPVIT